MSLPYGPAGMVYTLKTRRAERFALYFFTCIVVLGAGFTWLDDFLSGTLKFVINATIVAVIFLFAIVGVLQTAFPATILRADRWGRSLYSTIRRRRVVFLAWHEIASIEVVIGSIKDFEGSTAILVIRATTPGGRARGYVNNSLSRSAIQDAVFVDLADPRNIVWLLPLAGDFDERPLHAHRRAVADGINAVRTWAQRNNGLRGDSSPERS